VEYLSSRGITVFLVNVPVIDLLNEIDPEDQERVLDIFRAAATMQANVHFLNYNPEYAHRHELFFDLSHLNEQGKQIITARLVADIKKTIGKNDLVVSAPKN
jgi:DNA repair photolyase